MCLFHKNYIFLLCCIRCRGDFKVLKFECGGGTWCGKVLELVWEHFYTSDENLLDMIDLNYFDWFLSIAAALFSIKMQNIQISFALQCSGKMVLVSL